jgi:Ca2+:H+ antiporter
VWEGCLLTSTCITVYACYLIFQLWSHTHLYNDNHKASNRHSVKLPKETLAVFRREKRTEHESQVVDSSNMCQMDSGRWNNGLQSTPLTPPPYLDSATGTPYKSRSELTLASPRVDVEKSSNPVDPTVRLVYDSGGTTMSRNESSISGSFNSVSSADSMQDGDLEYLGQRNNYEQVSDTSPQGHENSAQVKREPQLSWLLTLSSLIVVTIVSSFTYSLWSW